MYLNSFVKQAICFCFVNLARVRSWSQPVLSNGVQFLTKETLLAVDEVTSHTR